MRCWSGFRHIRVHWRSGSIPSRTKSKTGRATVRTRNSFRKRNCGGPSRRGRGGFQHHYERRYFAADPAILQGPRHQLHPRAGNGGGIVFGQKGMYKTCFRFRTILWCLPWPYGSFWNHTMPLLPNGSAFSPIIFRTRIPDRPKRGKVPFFGLAPRAPSIGEKHPICLYRPLITRFAKHPMPISGLFGWAPPKALT